MYVPFCSANYARGYSIRLAPLVTVFVCSAGHLKLNLSTLNTVRVLRMCSEIKELYTEEQANSLSLGDIFPYAHTNLNPACNIDVVLTLH